MMTAVRRCIDGRGYSDGHCFGGELIPSSSGIQRRKQGPGGPKKKGGLLLLQPARGAEG